MRRSLFLFVQQRGETRLCGVVVAPPTFWFYDTAIRCAMENNMKEIIKKIGISSHPALRFLARMLRSGIKSPLFQLLKFRKEREMITLIQTIEKERGFMMWPDEMVMLYTTARSMRNKPGDFAELGVSSAGSAKLLCELKGDKAIHLFDTFEGLPSPDGNDQHLKKGQYKCSLPAVKKYLEQYASVFYYPGYFPLTAIPAGEKLFSFVHLDVDLYQSTLDGIKFFYPRLSQGGVLISHDYSTVPGVKKAFDEFFSDKQETVIELPTSQCLVVKG